MFGCYYGDEETVRLRFGLDEAQYRIRKGAPMTGFVSFDDEDEEEVLDEEGNDVSVLTGKKITPAQFEKFAK